MIELIRKFLHCLANGFIVLLFFFASLFLILGVPIFLFWYSHYYLGIFWSMFILSFVTGLLLKFDERSDEE